MKKYIFIWTLILSVAPILVKAQFNYLPKSTKGKLIKHQNYSLSYVEEWEQAAWVAYELNASTIKGNAKRPSSFKADPMIATGSALHKDYTKSGYDRGHLLPAASMKMTQDAMKETFLMSNISPQKPYFNRGIWKKLEGKVRTWAGKYKKLYVVTGPIIKKPYRTIGANKVAIPQKFFKVIYNPYKKQAIAFILDNKKSDQTLKTYVTSIDQAEKITGIDFFPALPDQLENKIEKNSKISEWF